MILLSIESGSSSGSMALSVGEEMVMERVAYENDNARGLPAFVKEAATLHYIEFQHLDGIVFAEGPGSYTGLRIGAGLAKGLCYGRKIPLLTISTLRVLFEALKEQQHHLSADDLFFPMIDARRMEVYTMVFDAKGNARSEIRPIIVQDDLSILTMLKGTETSLHNFRGFYFGSGAQKCIPILNLPTWNFVPNVHPFAKFMARIVENGIDGKHYNKLNIKDLAYYEPLYLKPFVAIQGQVKGLYQK